MVSVFHLLPLHLQSLSKGQVFIMPPSGVSTISLSNSPCLVVYQIFLESCGKLQILTTHSELRHRILFLSSLVLRAQEYSPIIKVYSPGFPKYILIGVKSLTQECFGPINLNFCIIYVVPVLSNY